VLFRSNIIAVARSADHLKKLENECKNLNQGRVYIC